MVLVAPSRSTPSSRSMRSLRSTLVLAALALAAAPCALIWRLLAPLLEGAR